VEGPRGLVGGGQGVGTEKGRTPPAAAAGASSAPETIEPEAAVEVKKKKRGVMRDERLTRGGPEV